MDEAIWAVIGMISVILGVGIIANIFVSLSNADNSAALDILEAQCNQVCSLAKNSSSSVSVDLLKDTVLTVEDELICAEECRRCGCVFEDATILNLTDAFFTQQQFSCRFTKGTQDSISLRCEG